MMHWKQLGTEQKIDAIKAVYQPGMSARAIAAAIGDDISKGAIIGMYNRYRDELTDCKLNASARMLGALTRASSKGRVRRVRKGTVLVAVPFDLFIAKAPHVAGIPLEMTKRGMCKFAVNDADKGETHLFCGSPGEGSWCGFHRNLVYRTTGKATPSCEHSS